MRRFLLIFIVVLLIICLATLAWNRQTASNLLPEIEPAISFTFGQGKSFSSQCNDRMPEVTLPKSSIAPSELAVIVNDRDPQSVAVGSYYQQRRNIPTENVIHVELPPGVDEIAPATFQSIKSQVDAALDTKIQAIALSFSRPFRVGCMSITSAFTLGYDDSFCKSKQLKICRLPKIVPYYNSDSVAPFTDLGIRPSMMLAGATSAEVFQLIDRGVVADAKFPKAAGYLITTTDKNRSTRNGEFSLLSKIWNNNSGWKIKYLNNAGGKVGSDFITKTKDVLFYFTGLTRVPKIETNRYLPGAIADHLTSAGGFLFSSGQMSVLNWLNAGVTASYGTVVEPCNLTEKFPNPEIVVRNYYKGQTALEAYWKSVASPQEGVFVGEPLASPMKVKITENKDYLSLKLSSLEPNKKYQVYGAERPEGVYLPVSEAFGIPSYQTVQMNYYCDKLYYKLREITEK